jgi:predicted 3-demethylubiquinone-9 3-methyltransferase (glyoxalase superfamily)
MQKITPCLWTKARVEDLLDYYGAIFKGSKVLSRMPGPNGLVTATIELLGHPIMILAGANVDPTDASSLWVDCKDQAEIDHYWNALIADGGEESMCGWLKDKYGFSWQIFPSRMTEMFTSSDRAAAGRAMQAMMQMRKIDLAAAERAYAGT